MNFKKFLSEKEELNEFIDRMELMSKTLKNSFKGDAMKMLDTIFRSIGDKEANLIIRNIEKLNK